MFKKKETSKVATNVRHTEKDTTVSKYSMFFCLISKIIQPRIIILSRVNNFNIKQKKAWNICFIICHQHETRSGKIKGNKIQQISVKIHVFYVKAKLQHF